MGHIHNETLNQNRGVHEWENISLSEIDTIKSLIKNRSGFDKFYEAKLYESQSPMHPNDIPQFHEIIEVIYLDLERLIKNCNLTHKQNLVVQNLMRGYTEQDICELNNWDISSIRSCFNTACKKIKEHNDSEWNEWIEVSGNVKISDNIIYKRCTSCGRDLRVNEENFKFDITNNRFKSRCRKCDK